MNDLKVVKIHISDLLRLMSNMQNGDYIGLAARQDGAEGANFYFLVKIDLPVGNLDPIFVINYFGPNSPIPATAPHAFYPKTFLLKAALNTRRLLLKNDELFVSETDYRRFN